MPLEGNLAYEKKKKKKETNEEGWFIEKEEKKRKNMTYSAKSIGQDRRDRQNANKVPNLWLTQALEAHNTHLRKKRRENAKIDWRRISFFFSLSLRAK